MGKRTLSHEGFTMIELMIVLAVLGILSILAAPKINNSNFYLKMQGKKLCSEIRQIQISRMTLGEEYKITLSPEKYVVQNGPKDLKTIPLMPGYELLYDFNKNTIMFQYNGAPTYGGTTVRIRNKRSGKYIEITIVPASGRVLMKEEICKP
ncbi:MAG TPA: prepilin-type N-terminal cleavage/methylation domain-containing protein [Clostridiales bacterium]|nr:prepilin-type N-terminal cleavage/methylation domain-containing protein [Clostridiales bacterium]